MVRGLEADSKRTTALLDEAARRVTFLDESNISYEAARLASVPCIIVFSDVDRLPLNCTVAKGEEEFKAYLRGETDSLEYQSVFARTKNAAHALRRALFVSLVK